MFKIDEKKRLGTMRVDWNDGRICNQWNPTNLLMELRADSIIDLGKLQKELNYLQFDLLPSFKRVEKYCGGTGYDSETLFTISLEAADYAIKLIAVKDAYSYIYTYQK
ncbi:hypothetical protein KPL51_12285 [Clostridium bowmanii]|nr:hypothetical protein [Clostridium bowmanii]